MKKPRERLNKKRLKIEIIVIAVIIFGVILWRFLPWFFVQPVSVPDDPYASYRKLYEDVVAYDFSAGPSEELEGRITRALSGNSSPIQLYYNLKAKIEYNYQLGNYEEALETLKEAKDYAPITAEREYVENLEESITLVYNI